MNESAEEPGHALIQVPTETVALPAEEWTAAQRYLAAALAPSTRYAYFRAFINFAAWCKERGLIAVPAEPETVAAFLAHEADRGVSPAAIGVKTAAIGAAHEAADHDPPTKTMIVRRVLSGIRRTKGGKRLDRDALLGADVIKVVESIPTWRYRDEHSEERAPSLRGLRDRALILIGFSLAARRSELAALEVDHVEIVDEGLIVTFPKSKTDQEGKGQRVAVPRGKKLCPVKALADWLAAARIIEGPVFRGISKADRVLPRGLDGRQIARIVKARSAAAGITDKAITGHSLRSGFLTTAASNRANIWKMAEVSRHKDLKQLRAYVQKTELFDDHAGEGIF